MLGLIPKILIDLLDEQAGRSAVESVLARAGLPADHRFRLGTVYSDEVWQTLLAAALDVLGLDQATAEKAYADCFCRDAVKRWPMWFEMAKSSKEFLERQPAIHNSFASGVASDEARQRIEDKFTVEAFDDAIRVRYRSENRLCGLYKDLAEWIANHCGDTIEFEEHACLKEGADHCDLEVRWTHLANDGS